ncbi:hypothetical protein [Nocardia sp. NPDC051832]|uniref:hypothetical protein n=1 Tax=Nocardia sp. NPDC051832 TaxID=3155673 RepID=UPI00341A0A83
MKKRAVLYLLKDLSGKNQERHEREMANLAREWGFDVARRLAIPRTSTTPLMGLVKSMYKVEAAAVFVPNLAHLMRGERAVTERCLLVDTSTRATYRKYHKWPNTLGSKGYSRDFDFVFDDAEKEEAWLAACRLTRIEPQ